jgi:exonuclease III
MRIFSWNINGIAPFLQKPITSFFKTSPRAVEPKDTVPSASLRGFLHRHYWPAMLFLQEVKIFHTDNKTQDAVRTAINTESSPSDSGPKYDAHFTLPTDVQNARGPRGSGKVYGVCSILRRDLYPTSTVNVRTVDWDNEGRVSVDELTSGKEKLAVFNIYAVNGTDNPYRDPATGRVKGTRHDRKRRFHAELSQECRKLEGQGWDVLIGGDVNIAPDARDGWPNLRVFPQAHVLNRADFHERFLDSGKEVGLGGVDVWREMHEGERRYTYYPRSREWGTSCDRVDFFVLGRKAWDKGLITGCGILDSEAERGPSDHVPIWVDVSFPSTSTPEDG